MTDTKSKRSEAKQSVRVYVSTVGELAALQRKCKTYKLFLRTVIISLRILIRIYQSRRKPCIKGGSPRVVIYVSSGDNFRWGVWLGRRGFMP